MVQTFKAELLSQAIAPSMLAYAIEMVPEEKNKNQSEHRVQYLNHKKSTIAYMKNVKSRGANM